jgi:hypothetical protein
MPRPWIIDNEEEESFAAELFKHLSVAAAVGTVAALIWLGHGAARGKVFAATSTGAAVAFRGLIYAFPIVVALVINGTSLRYLLLPGETVLWRGSYMRSLRAMWWVLLPIWPGAVVGAMLLIQKLAEPLPLADGAGGTGGMPYRHALFAFALTLVGAFLCLGLFAGSSEMRCDDEGVRCGLPYFMEWQSITQAVMRPRVIELYHRARPTLPMRIVSRKNPKVEATLVGHLKRHGIPIREGIASKEPLLIGLYVVVTALLAAGAWVIWESGRVARHWTFSGTLAAGMLACTLLERIRGNQHLTKVRPMTTTLERATYLAPGQPHGFQVFPDDPHNPRGR